MSNLTGSEFWQIVSRSSWGIWWICWHTLHKDFVQNLQSRKATISLKFYPEQVRQLPIHPNLWKMEAMSDHGPIALTRPNQFDSLILGIGNRFANSRWRSCCDVHPPLNALLVDDDEASRKVNRNGSEKPHRKRNKKRLEKIEHCGEKSRRSFHVPTRSVPQLCARNSDP